MKKLFTLLFLATSMICFGQNKNFLKEVESINFYGVDYSAAKVFGAAETPAQFKVAFDGINRLFITEAKKYDVSKKLKVRVNEISLDAVNQVNEAIDPQELMIIAKLLNKAEAYGSYQVVFFNTETKEIIQDWATGGKARGFGLRNYWAGSIHKVIRNL